MQIVINFHAFETRALIQEMALMAITIVMENMTTLFKGRYTNLGKGAMEYYPSINNTHGDSVKINSWYVTSLYL